MGLASGAGSTRAGWKGTCATDVWLTGGAFHTTAKTTAAGLTMASEKTIAKTIRSGRDRKTE